MPFVQLTRLLWYLRTIIGGMCLLCVYVLFIVRRGIRMVDILMWKVVERICWCCCAIIPAPKSAALLATYVQFCLESCDGIYGSLLTGSAIGHKWESVKTTFGMFVFFLLYLRFPAFNSFHFHVEFRTFLIVVSIWLMLRLHDNLASVYVCLRFNLIGFVCCDHVNFTVTTTMDFAVIMFSILCFTIWFALRQQVVFCRAFVRQLRLRSN